MLFKALRFYFYIWLYHRLFVALLVIMKMNIIYWKLKYYTAIIRVIPGQSLWAFVIGNMCAMLLLLHEVKYILQQDQGTIQIQPQAFTSYNYI